MGIFSNVARFAGNALETAAKVSDTGLRAATDTFISPVARAALTFPVTAVRGVQGLAGNEKAQTAPVKTPFGDVKPMANLLDKKSREAPGTLKAGEAAMGAVELATSVPGVAEKVVAKGLQFGAKALGPLAEPA